MSAPANSGPRLSTVTWVRVAGGADVAAIGRVVLRGLGAAPSASQEADEWGSGPEPVGRELLRNARIDGDLLLLAEVGVTPVGVVRVSPREMSSSRHIGTLALCVDPGWRSQGVGRVALAAAERRAWVDLAVERLEVRVSSDDLALRGLVRSSGYRCERRERHGLLTASGPRDVEVYVLDR